MTHRAIPHLCALSCLAALLGCTGPARSPRPDERSAEVSSEAPPSAEPAPPARAPDEHVGAAASDDLPAPSDQAPAPTSEEDGDPACRTARRALETFVEELPTDCQTDADCMVSHVLMGCAPTTAHTRSAFTPQRLARMSELRQRIRAICPTPRIVCGPSPFDPGACEAGRCRITRTYN